MMNRSDKTTIATSQLDPEHDLDLVALFNNARTDQDVDEASQITRNRMRARTSAPSIGNPLRAFALRRRV